MNIIPRRTILIFQKLLPWRQSVLDGFDSIINMAIQCPFWIRNASSTYCDRQQHFILLYPEIKKNNNSIQGGKH